jgi:hypothetical protein
VVLVNRSSFEWPRWLTGKTRSRALAGNEDISVLEWGLGEFFCSGIPAYRVEFEVSLNRKIAERWYGIPLRGHIALQEIKAQCALSGEIEMDEVAKASLPYSGIS